jgi:hypothetical protein
MTNNERCKQAHDMLQNHPLWKSDYEDDPETGLCDVLADLMHWARINGYDFDNALRKARYHHDAEAAQGDDVPTEM